MCVNGCIVCCCCCVIGCVDVCVRLVLMWCDVKDGLCLELFLSERFDVNGDVCWCECVCWKCVCVGGFVYEIVGVCVRGEW